MAGKEIEEIKKKIDLVEFIKGYIDLQPAGKSLKALCPFHGEKTPSFVVSPDRGRWHCFGSCGEGGDIFTFLMKYENIEFYEALQILAERAGVELRRLDPQKQREFGVLYDINEEAKKFFRDELRKNPRITEYLKNRGLKDPAIETFDLGYSPGGEALTMRLIRLGYDVRDIERAGVAYKNSRGNYWDRFQKRIMFPIANSVGKVVAFTGRITPEEESAGGDAPKYLNSPETPIFHKSKILYGHHITKKAIGDKKTAFLVEGQMDVVMSWQAGVENVVAVSGTALTEHHLEKLRRSADSVILSFDNDEAGMRAMERALEVFSRFDFFVQVVDLGEHKDPADAAHADPEFLTGAIQKAKAAFPRLFELRLREIGGSDMATRKRVIRELLGKIQSIPSHTEQESLIGELSKISGISERALRAEIDALPQKRITENNLTAAPSETREEEGGEGRLSRTDRICRRILAFAFFDPTFLEAVRKEEKLLPERYQTILREPEGETAARIAMQGAHLFGGVRRASLEEEVKELLRELRLEVLRLKREEIRLKIREFERSGREADSLRFLREYQEVSREMDAMKR